MISPDVWLKRLHGLGQKERLIRTHKVEIAERQVTGQKPRDSLAAERAGDASLISIPDIFAIQAVLPGSAA